MDSHENSIKLDGAEDNKESNSTNNCLKCTKNFKK